MWKDIKGYEGLYQVSDKGQVRRFYKDRYPKMLKNRPSANYYTVSLSNKCVKKTFAVHRLVAETFLDKPEGATEVNHKDGNKLNNRVENLEWVSQRENIRHAIEVLGNCPYGKKPRAVKCFDPWSGVLINEYRSVSDAARSLGKASARTAITQCCQGTANSAYGYKWQYAD